MKKIFSKLSLGLILALVVGFFGYAPSLTLADGPSSRKIVVFKAAVPKAHRDEVLARHLGAKVKDLDLVDGVVANLSPRAEAALKNESDVVRIEDDLIVEALEKVKPAAQPAEVLPWGILKVKADQVWPTTTADLIKVAVVDTGIQLSHPDLAANIKGGYNAINPTRTADDDNGHGTHVAGIIAGIDNTIGVVGVGPQIDLYAVKVLNRNGSGFLSDIIEGLDWAIANHMQVVNMSLGTSSFSQSFADAVARVNAAGIVQVAAAGNSGPGSNTVIYPAKFPQVTAVAATDSSNTVASFSSRGAAIDLAAPGVSVYSTYKGSTYATLSGTSMASPHVAGVAALLLSVSAKCDLDLSGSCSPAEVQQRLEATALDLGASGKDTSYGSGLVNAYAAVVGP